MGEYSAWCPRDDWGPVIETDVIEFFGEGAVVPYEGYGPSLGPNYPHGPYDEPDMGWDWGRRERAERDERRRWEERRRGFFGWLGDLFGGRRW